MAYATWNPSDKNANITLSNGDLTATSTNTAWKSARATLGKSSGKWYWELTINAQTTSNMVAVAGSAAALTTHIGVAATGYGYNGQDGKKWNNNTNAAYGATFAAGAIISIALDMDNGKIWFAKNGTWQASGDPAAGTNAAYTGLSGTLYPALSLYYNNNRITANFGASAFSYTVPDGFTGVSDDVGTTYLEDWSLDIAAYYQRRQDLLTWLGITDGTRLQDLLTDIAAYLESTGDDLPAWLGAGYEHMDDLKSWLGLLATTQYRNLKTDLSIRAQKLDDLKTWIGASKTTFKDLASWLGVTDGTVFADLASWLGITDGNVFKDLRVWARVISAIPAFRSVTAHRVSSVIHEM